MGILFLFLRIYKVFIKKISFFNDKTMVGMLQLHTGPHEFVMCVLKQDLWDGGNCLQQVLTY